MGIEDGAVPRGPESLGGWVGSGVDNGFLATLRAKLPAREGWRWGKGV